MTSILLLLVCQTPSIPTTGSGYTSGKSAGARSAAAAFGDSDSEDESEAAGKHTARERGVGLWGGCGCWSMHALPVTPAFAPLAGHR